MAIHPDPNVEFSGSSAAVQQGLLTYVPDFKAAARVVGVSKLEVWR